MNNLFAGLNFSGQIPQTNNNDLENILPYLLLQNTIQSTAVINLCNNNQVLISNYMRYLRDRNNSEEENERQSRTNFNRSRQNTFTPPLNRSSFTMTSPNTFTTSFDIPYSSFPNIVNNIEGLINGIHGSNQNNHEDTSNNIITYVPYDENIEIDDHSGNIIEFEEYSDINNPINDICPISREEFEDDTTVYMIKNCKHIFKKLSLRQWFSMNITTCPYCRRNVLH